MMRSRWVRRAFWVSLLASSAVVFLAGSASADGVDREEVAGGAFSWIPVTDSSGTPIWKYALDIDHGGFTDLDKRIWATLVGWVWAFYKVGVMLPLWLLDWVLSFDWLQILASPMLLLGDSMTSVVGKLGLTVTLLTVTAVVAVFWMMRGRWATGTYEIGMSLVISALAVGILANPVQQVAGPGGYLEQAHRAGLEISAALANEGDSSSKSIEQMREEQTQRLADAFVGDPYQVVNFGYVLSAKCEKAYSASIKAKKFGQTPKAREAIEDCDSQAKEYADNPNEEMFMSTLVFVPAALAIMLLSLLVAASVLVAGAWALFQSVKLIVTVLCALLPGAARGPFWATLAETIMALVMVVFTSAFLGGFLLVISTVFTSAKEGGRSPVAAFAIVDVVLFVGVFVFWKWRSNVKASAGRLASALATRPGGGVNPTVRQPRPVASYAAKAAQAGMWAATHRALRSSSGGQKSRPNAQNVDAARSGHVTSEFVQPTKPESPAAPTPIETPARKRLISGGVSASAGDSGKPKPPRMGKAVALAAGAMTGGGSLAIGAGTKVALAKGAGRAVTSARRAAVSSRLSSATPTPPQAAVHRPAPIPAASSKQYDRVVRNGHVLLVPRATNR